MADYSEEEQVERLRKWWEQNGTSVVLAVVLAVAALLGWRYWQGVKHERAAGASMVYEEMMDSFQQWQAAPDSDVVTEQVRASANTLVSDFGSTAYADYARFLLARLAVEKGDHAEAAGLLREVMDSPASKSIGWTARARLARVLLHSGELDQAATVLNASWPASWQGQAFELRGDLARLRGDLDGARQAYQSALNALGDDGTGFRELVQMKLDDLAPAS